MPSNAEILAQLESLAEAAIAGATIHVECDGLRGMAFLNALKGADFPAILAAVKRWIKIEEAAKLVEEWMQERKEWLINNERYEAAAEMRDRQHPLWAALKEPQ